MHVVNYEATYLALLRAVRLFVEGHDGIALGRDLLADSVTPPLPGFAAVAASGRPVPPAHPTSVPTPVVSGNRRIMHAEKESRSEDLENAMSVVRTNYLPEFDYGTDAVLLTVDGIGVAAVLRTLREAIQKGTASLKIDNVTHDFVISAGRADLNLKPGHVVWQLDPDKAEEIAAGLTVLHDSVSAGHIYVDIQRPATSLVISRDEYLHIEFPWIDPPT